MRFEIHTSGKGMLPAGRVVGHIEADTAAMAEDALIASGQISDKYRGFLLFVPTKSSPEVADEKTDRV